MRAAWWVLLGGTAVLYLWDLGASGWANSFYAAAAQAGSESWKAFFFGSLDAGNAITVDKPPASLWVMGLSVRIFGLSSWAILVPQALMGVAAVGLLHATVRRSTGSAAAGLLAGLVLALTPVAVLMFRYNNPDALLTLLLIGAAAATLRAVEATRARAEGTTAHPVAWLALGGALVGAAFLTKMLQAFLVLPALVAVYLIAAHTPLGKRLGHLLVAFATMIATAGWWIAIVTLWPATDRPYIGGSTTNSILQLTLGYNGLGRLSGDETGSVGGAGGGGGGWGSTGLLRLLGGEVGGQIAWLLPAAVIALVAGLWFGRRAPRTDPVRAGLLLWGGWLVVTALTFSFMAGIFHAYYTVALAPAIAALVGIGVHVLWRSRPSYAASITLAGAVAFTAGFNCFLLARTSDYLPWLRWAVLVLGLVAALGLCALGRAPRRWALAVAGLATVASLLAPAAFAVTTATTPHSGSIPAAGPASTSGGPGGLGFPGGRPGGPGVSPGRGGGTGTMPTAPPGGFAPGGGFAGGTAGWTGGGGGLLDASTPPAAMTRLLEHDASSYTWAAATVGSNNASGYQLATQLPVMAIGGFNGSDASPTLAQFEADVAAGRIHYFIDSGQGGGGGISPGGATSTAITSWVSSHFRASTVGGTSIYDLSGGTE